LRSAPAQNTPPAPQSTPTRKSSSRSNSRKASANARAAGPSTALRASGRSSTIVATWSLRSIRIAIAVSVVRSRDAALSERAARPPEGDMPARRGQAPPLFRAATLLYSHRGMDLLASHALRTPDAPALIEGERHLTWQEFVGTRNRVANGLGRLG